MDEGRESRAGGRTTAVAARVIVGLRFLIVPGWIALAILAAVNLPSVFGAKQNSVGDLVPNNSPALEVEKRAEQTFGLPLLSRTMVVGTQPGGLSAGQAAKALRYAARVDASAGSNAVIKAALPLSAIRGRSFQASPGSTLITYLYMDPDLGQPKEEAAAAHFADRLRRASGIPQTYVTGSIPAHFRDTQVDTTWLPWVELATVLLVAGILGFYFRSVGVPLLALGSVAIAYTVASHALGWLSDQGTLSVPNEAEPVMVALLFGTLTDYAVFFVSGYRRRLAEGLSSRDAAVRVTTELLPVVLTAGLMIVGATLTLLLAGVKFLSEFGPGLAASVLVGVAVAVTFVPATLAMFGPLLLRPWRPTSPTGASDERLGTRGRLVSLATRFPATVAIVCVAALVAAATGVLHLRVGDTTLRGLPGDTTEHQGYDAASRAFAPGVIDPTMLVLSDRGIAHRRAALASVEASLKRQPGIATVIGPADSPPHPPHGVLLAPGGNGARFILIFDRDPLGATAINDLARLRSAIPRLVRSGGLAGATVGIAGDTALTAEMTDAMKTAFIRVGPAAIALLTLLLWALLRSRTAPLYLMAVSLLVVLAALGLTVYVFQGLLGYGEIAFFVPIAVAILLLALGCDYNVFLVGRIWSELGRDSVRGAVQRVGSRAARAITVAGVILALSFAALALIPTEAFRETAFAMCVGLLLDAFVARTLLIPALIVLFNRGAGDEGVTDAARAPRRTPARGALEPDQATPRQ